MSAPYDLEIDRVIATIAEKKPQRVCLQFADGLKPEARRVQEAILDRFPAIDIIIWGGSDFGGCDLPLGIEKLDIDLLIAFGHAPWVWGDELARYKKMNVKQITRDTQ